MVNVGTKQSRLHQMLEPVVTAMGCGLWGLDFSSNGRFSTLRIYIDKPEGILLDDCEKVSRQVSAILDVEDPISTEYTLEVSSPGSDRPLYKLEQFSQYSGETINLRLQVPYDGRRRFKGLLAGVEGEDIVLQCEGHEYLFPVESIDKANVVPNVVPLTGSEKEEADL